MLAMLGLRLPELLIILLVVVLLFGAKKLPELGDALGKGIRSFKKAAEHGLGDDEADTREAKSQGQLPPGAATQTSTSDAEKAHRGG
jgi:sec-independent protein translocase protein TatA